MFFYRFLKRQKEYTPEVYIPLTDESYSRLFEIADALLHCEDLARDSIKYVFENVKYNNNDYYNGTKILKGEDFPFDINPKAHDIIKGELFNFLNGLLENKMNNTYKKLCAEVGGRKFFIAFVIPDLIRDIDWDKAR